MIAPISKFIVDEPPMVVFRSLVRVFGLHEGHLLQHVHYWLHHKAQDQARYKDHFIDGRYWVHWTMAELQEQVPFGTSSSDPYKRVTRRLRQQGVLLVEKHGAAWDQTNWYSIDYSTFGKVVSNHLADATSSGGLAAGAAVATPPLHRRESTDSSSRQTTADYLTSKTTQKTTTTTTEVEVVGPSVTGKLDLAEIPDRLRTEVQDCLRHRPDAQRFADLLSAALVRSAKLPLDKQIGAPILYLKKLLSDTSEVDFSAADALAARREAESSGRQRATELVATEAVAAEKRRAAEASRIDAAERAIAAMSHDERQTLVRFANDGRMIRLPAAEMERSIFAGQLPRNPLARVSVLKALAAVSSDVSNERREAT